MIGAGLAGLSSALRLSESGWAVTVLEGAGQAGGRCRSYHDRQLDRRIDNGNHLLLAGNTSALNFLDTVGARDSLIEVAPARLPFVDLKSDQRWVLAPNAGPIPWWVAVRSRRVPDTRLGDYLAAARMARAGPRSVAKLFAGKANSSKRRLYDRFWEPMAVAVLNTEADQGAARLLWPIMTEILFRGEIAFRPCIARQGLTDSFVDPTIDWLRARGVEVRFNARVRNLESNGDTIDGLGLGSDTIQVGAHDVVVAAVPPAAAKTLAPDLTVPDDYRPIVNLHFVLDHPLSLPEALPLLGIIGGTAQWLFLRDDILSVTISAGVAEAEAPPEDLAAKVWRDIQKAVPTDHPQPRYRLVTEKRATIAQTPKQDERRPAVRTPVSNLFLAGDWTDTGLPATIEGAIRSGETVAAAIGPPAL